MPDETSVLWTRAREVFAYFLTAQKVGKYPFGYFLRYQESNVLSGVFAAVNFIYNYGNGAVAGYVTRRTERIHGDIQRNH